MDPNNNNTEEAEEAKQFEPGPPEEESFEVPVEVSRAVVSSTNTSTNPQVVTNIHDMDLDFVDHFSLKQPSANVKFRSKNVRIYELACDQLQLEHKVVTTAPEEDKGDTKNPLRLQITMHRMRGGSMGLRLLRTLYTLAALLMMGFLFVFAANTIAFQMMEIPIHGGTNENELDYAILVSALLSLPILLYSMASLMVYAMVFVGDTWNGHVLFGVLLAGEQRSRDRRVAVEWFFFAMFLAIPLVASSIVFYAQVDRAQEVSLFIWYACMNLTFFIFCALSFYHEIRLCLDFTRIVYGDGGRGMVGILYQALLVTQRQRFAGSKEESYVMEEGSLDSADEKANQHTWTGLYSRTTALACNPFFEPLDPPPRQYSMEEIREITPYVTNQTWSLEKMCCRFRNGRSRMVLTGPYALEPHQYRSTLACTIVGIVIAVLFAVGFLLYMGQSGVIVVVVGMVLIFCIGGPCLVSAEQVYKAMPEEINNTDTDEDEAPHFQSWARYTIAKPKDWYCWFRIIVETIVLFLWPMVSKFVSDLPKNGTLFLVIGLFSLPRLYLDAGSIIKEFGTMGSLDLSNHQQNDKNTPESDRKAKAMIARARASEIMGKVSSSARLWLWLLFYLGLAVYFFYMVATYDNGQGPKPNTGRPAIKVLNDFAYPGINDTMSYPLCKLDKGYAIPGKDMTYMTDYNMLAALAYETTNVTDYILDKWFEEEDFFVDETPLVVQWRKDSGNEEALVSFKLFSVPSQPGFGVIAIRGTEISRDRLLNMQLYMSSTLVQVLDQLIPYSWIFSSIYPDLIWLTSWVASEVLENSNYYSTVADFVNDLVRNQYTFQGKTFDTLRVTGVSLGGGLAMIVGAQTGAYAVGFAGPNPVLGRRTFIPEVSLEDINNRLINVLPDSDFASSIGGVVRNHQRIDCHKDWDHREYKKCHAFWMQLCEFLYQCGSGNRPTLCVCTELYGFPQPLPTGDRTNYTEACVEEEALVKPYMGQ